MIFRKVSSILSISVFCAALIVTLGRATAAERMLVNAKVFTGNRLAPYAEAVGIREGRILSVGARVAVAATLGSNAEVLDLGGRTLLPGLIDSHVHAIWGGVGLVTADVENRPLSVDELVTYTRQVMQSGRGMYGDVVVVNGVPLATWTQINQLKARFNGGEFARTPVALYGMDGHTVWGNDALLRRAKVDQKYLSGLPESKRKLFGTDAKLNPTGFAAEDGAEYITRVIPETDAARLEAGARAALRFLNSLGITAWLDPVDEDSVLDTYRSMAMARDLSAHVTLHIVVKLGDADPLSRVLAVRRKFEGVPNVRIGGIKVFADGVAEYPSQTAAMSSPYAETGRIGDLMFEPKRFADVCIAADREGLVIHVHAIGDRAVHETLNGIAAARSANPTGTLPHTITHAEFVRPEDIPRFSELGVIASLQLFWARVAPATVDLLKPYVDPAIYRWLYPARSLLDAGTVIAGASDWNVTSPNVFLAMYRAETRTSESGTLNPEEDMPREAMLYAYTINAARALGMQDRIGSIEPGKDADFVLVDRDVMTVPAESLREARVLWTMFGGEFVYRAP